MINVVKLLYFLKCILRIFFGIFPSLFFPHVHLTVSLSQRGNCVISTHLKLINFLYASKMSSALNCIGRNLVLSPWHFLFADSDPRAVGSPGKLPDERSCTQTSSRPPPADCFASEKPHIKAHNEPLIWSAHVFPARLCNQAARPSVIHEAGTWGDLLAGALVQSALSVRSAAPH